MADVLELHKEPDGSGLAYSIVEYKRGKPKPDDRDEVQLCAQAMCLEEMLSVKLGHGYLFYGETKHRHRVDFNETLHARTRMLAQRMHDLFARGETPPPKKGSPCKNCSLYDICVPKLADCSNRVEQYLGSMLAEMEIGQAGEQEPV